MSLTVHLSPRSANAKTGPIPVSTTSADSCPPTCPLKAGGCYANGGPLHIHWQAVTEGRRGTDWQTFCSQIAALPEGQLWRHNQAGDLPGTNGVLDRRLVMQLVEANRGRHGFTYTHYPANKRNAAVVAHANANGFTINLSADDLDEADRLADLQVGPVVTLLPTDAPARTNTPGGRVVVKCPAQYRDAVTCATCVLCARADRKVIVGFEVHGAQRRHANRIADACR